MKKFVQSILAISVLLFATIATTTDPVTPNLGLTLTAVNEANWNVPVNNNFTLIDTAVAGKQAFIGIVNPSNSNVPADALALFNYADPTSEGHNIFFGHNAGNTTMGPGGGGSYLGSEDIGIGEGSLGFLTTAYYVTALGAYALSSDTVGQANTAIGAYSMQYNTSGYHNTALGWKSLWQSTTSHNNLAIGAQSLLQLTTGYFNVAIGDSSLATVSTGWGNTAGGFDSLYLATGSQNSAFGFNALSQLTTGQYNTVLGYQSGYGDGPTTNRQSTVDTYMLFLGFQASRDGSVAQSTVLTDSIVIGNNATVATSHTTVIGGPTNTTVQLTGNTSATGTLAAGAGASTNHAICWKTNGILGYCSAVVASDGTCGTCQ